MCTTFVLALKVTKLIMEIRKAECCKIATGKFQVKRGVKIFWS
jgi:hypothetical protein